eukprot:gene17-8_t
MSNYFFLLLSLSRFWYYNNAEPKHINTQWIPRQGFVPTWSPETYFPYREHAKQIATAPAGGFYLTKYALGWPFQIPFEWLFWRSAVSLFVGCVAFDLLFGLPLPLIKEGTPGKPKHFFFGNSAGVPHHFWQYQDGWTVPNMSGGHRWFNSSFACYSEVGNALTVDFFLSV